MPKLWVQAHLLIIRSSRNLSYLENSLFIILVDLDDGDEDCDGIFLILLAFIIYSYFMINKRDIYFC